MRPHIPEGRWRLIAAFAVELATIIWIYGLVGGSLPFGTVSLWDGWSRCLAAGPLPCLHIGYPIGVDTSIATPVIYGTYWLSKVGLATGTALNILGILSITAGLAAMWQLGRSLGGTHLSGALAGAIYFASPLLIQHQGLYQLFLGFALLPVPVALAMAISGDPDEPCAWRWRMPMLLGGLLAAGLVLVYLDPYPWVVAFVVALPVPLVALWRAARGRSLNRALFAVVTLTLLAVPGAVFRIHQSTADLEVQVPVDFHRGMGVDLGVALIPTTSSTLGAVTGAGASPWSAQEFTGDGSQLASAYLGLPLMVLAGCGIAVLMWRGRRQALLMVGLGGVACIVLSLGPSLKVLDRDPTPRGETLVPGDYLMPAADATLALPWAPIFEQQPFASMRATYRWQSGARIVLACLAAVALGAVAGRRPVVAVAVATLVLLDVAPRALWDQRSTASERQSELEAFEDDMDRAYGGGRITPGARVLFLPAANDYLVQYIAPRFDLRAYNLSFDKAITQIRPQQPKAITDALVHWSDSTLSAEELCGLFQADLVDAVVFNDYSLRWASYSWPPSEESIRERRAVVEDSGLLSTPGLEVDRAPLAIVTTSSPNGPCQPG